MARGKEKFGQLMLDNEDSLCKIRGNVRLLEMLHDEWSRLRVHDLGPSTTGDEFLERRFGVASKLREDLARIEEDLLSVNQRMVNDLSQYNTNRMKPIFQRIERRFNNRMVFEFDSFNHSSKTVDRATTVARVASGSDHSERLYKHYNWLLDKVDACSVANKMFEYRAISKPQLESVQVYRNNLCRAVEILLKIILAEPVPVYDAFKEALIETNQDDVYLTLAGIGQLMHMPIYFRCAQRNANVYEGSKKT
jgi:hypothetical protein